jgi:hypothetical protein
MDIIKALGKRIFWIIVPAFVAALAIVPGTARAGDWDWDDIFAPYRQRLDTMTSSSGNAQRVNTVTHIDTPWPRNVRNRRIPADGTRMVGAIKRYQDGNKQRLPQARRGEKTSASEMPLEPPPQPETTGKTSVGAIASGAANTGGPGAATSMPNPESGKTGTSNSSDQAEK